ncbi:hypothetical protein E3E14_21325 [Streptomyces sp. ICN441]|uniref:hypothetical protein n=1 Tax=Streptomyces sp. ICN441 TaxID=2558286 RepID=UPI001068E524|nr:hypothetical protein [Streptomyces sp. ICN441]TFE47345.1 hypothetical protein E3E14_21325 [Streptomyces sp. ICN441]
MLAKSGSQEPHAFGLAVRAVIEIVGVASIILLVQLAFDRSLGLVDVLIAVGVGVLAARIDPLWGAWRRKR